MDNPHDLPTILDSNSTLRHRFGWSVVILLRQVQNRKHINLFVLKRMCDVSLHVRVYVYNRDIQFRDLFREIMQGY